MKMGSLSWLSGTGEEILVPRIPRGTFPASVAHHAEHIRCGVEHHGVEVAALPELGAGHGADDPATVPEKNTIGIEDADAELTLQLLQSSEEPVDRTAGRLFALLHRDDEEDAVDDVTARQDGMTVRCPGVEKWIDSLEYELLLSDRKGGCDAEHPHASLVGESGEIGAWHEGALS